MDKSEDKPRLSLAPGYRLQWEEAQGVHVLLFPEGMIRLSESAAEILKRCDGICAQEDVIDKLNTAFPGVDLRADVVEFLETAIERSWLIKT